MEFFGALNTGEAVGAPRLHILLQSRRFSIKSLDSPVFLFHGLLHPVQHKRLLLLEPPDSGFECLLRLFVANAHPVVFRGRARIILNEVVIALLQVPLVARVHVDPVLLFFMQFASLFIRSGGLVLVEELLQIVAVGISHRLDLSLMLLDALGHLPL